LAGGSGKTKQASKHEFTHGCFLLPAIAGAGSEQRAVWDGSSLSPLNEQSPVQLDPGELSDAQIAMNAARTQMTAKGSAHPGELSVSRLPALTSASAVENRTIRSARYADLTEGQHASFSAASRTKAMIRSAPVLSRIVPIGLFMSAKCVWGT
jgi:hypothetical protein